MYHYVRSLKNSAYPEIKGLETTKFQKQLEYFKKKFEFGNFIEIIDSAYKNNEIKKNEIINFYSNIAKNKKIIVKQMGPNGFLISKNEN